WSHGQWRVFRMAEGLPSEEVNCLLEDSTGSLWIGSSRGLAVYGSGRMENVGTLWPPLRDQILALEEDRRGTLWIATSNRVLRVDLEMLRRRNVTESGVREYDLQDGLRSLETTRRDRALFRDENGRIWLSTARGVSVIDPSGLADRGVPALGH